MFSLGWKGTNFCSPSWGGKATIKGLFGNICSQPSIISVQKSGPHRVQLRKWCLRYALKQFKDLGAS